MTHLADYTSPMKDFHKYKYNQNMPPYKRCFEMKPEKKKERVWLTSSVRPENTPTSIRRQTAEMKIF